MNIGESIMVALDSIRSNLFRSALTTLGIVIGIAAVIAVVAIGQGGRATVIGEMEKIGSNLFAVYIDWRSDQPRTGDEFTLKDMEAIKEQIPEIKYLSPSAYAYDQVRGGKNTKAVQIMGVSSDYAPMRNLTMKEGRFFSSTDEQGRRRLAAIDEGLAEELFSQRSAIGEQIVVAGTSLTIVGVVKQEGSIFSMGGSQYVYMPIRVWMDIFPWNYISQMEGTTHNREDVQAATGKVVTILERRHQGTEYMSETLDQQMEIVGNITGIMTMIIGAIAGISLLVGGIGVMNIMLVSVTERTREIGLRMALGARRKDILTQFLIEATVLCLIGGIIGMTLGVGGAYLIAKLAHWPPLVSWTTMLLAFVFSALIGILFGLLPANKASRLDPIEALRRD
jgi:putative ABC transport system permease protein